MSRLVLRDEVTSGRLDAAPSKAEVLAGLCDKLGFDPDAASALHKQLYKQKLDSLLSKKHLTGKPVGFLRIRPLNFCLRTHLPEETRSG